MSANAAYGTLLTVAGNVIVLRSGEPLITASALLLSWVPEAKVTGESRSCGPAKT